MNTLNKLFVFINEHKTSFKHETDYIKKTLMSLYKHSFIYITGAITSEKAAAFRKELKQLLLKAGFTNVVTNDEVFDIINRFDFVITNTAICRVAKLVNGLVIELNYKEFIDNEN